MINDKELKELLQKEVIEDTEVCQIIQKYIFDRKGVEIEVNRPRAMHQLMIMQEMYNHILGYYVDKL